MIRLTVLGLLVTACAPAGPASSQVDATGPTASGPTPSPTSDTANTTDTATTPVVDTDATGHTGDTASVPDSIDSARLDSADSADSGWVDSDGDGLGDAQELALGTDPALPDTDGGGLLDGAEIHYATDPLDGTDDLVTVPIDQAPAHFVGRWGLDDPAAPWCAWQGCTLALRFDGTAVAIDLDPGAAAEGFRVLVDGDDLGRIEVSSGVQTVTLAEGLAVGPHDLELVRETYRGTNLVVGTVSVTGAGLETPADRPTRHIVFYGDSNLAGDSLTSERNHYGWQHVGTHFGLAGILARRFDADYQNISVSGETTAGLEQLVGRMDYWSPQPAYDHSRFPADVVVVNVGANDVYSPLASRRADMLSLWATLRAAHPDAHIVVANGFGWSFAEPATFTRDLADDFGDADMSVVHFPWVFEQWHGCEYDHAGMADVIAQHLEGELGWVADDSDVLVGFATDGVVANGSFEGLAPFGGFAWRYLDGVGVERLVDPALAHDGDALLRLADGGSVHQPWPASAGDTVAVTAWLHGAAGGEQAELTVDARDGEMYSMPMFRHDEAVTLAAGWQEVSFEVELPGDTPRPIVHTRLTLRALPGSTVEVDQVSTTTTP